MPTIVVVADERAGLLSDISYILGKEGIRMESVGIEVAGGKAVMSMEVRDTHKAKKVLTKNGFQTVDKGVVLKLPDYFSKIDDIKKSLEEEKIFLKEWTLISGEDDKGIVALEVDKPRKALRLLCEFLI